MEIIKFINKTTPTEEFDNINKVPLDEISENIEYIVQTGNYYVISTKYPKTMGYYTVIFFTNKVTMKEQNTKYGNLFK